MNENKMAKRSSCRPMMGKRLSDITNSLPEKLPPDDVSAKEYIDRLVKEKMALMKHIQEKNKIIEVSGIEIQNLRNYIQKMKLQNWGLAQINSQMLGEVNMGKERLKALQHELACKQLLVKTKNIQLEETVVLTNGTQIKEDVTNNGRRRSRSLGSSTTCQEKEVAATKRSKIKDEEARDKLFEIDEAQFGIGNDEGRRRRSSISRPSRRAADKVQSYKETRVNIKMRRHD